MIESGSHVHVNLVIICEMCNECRNISSNQALRTGIRAIVRSESTPLFMLDLLIVGSYILAAQSLVPTGELQ